ncbi:hypothetical protein C8J56DRAFT_893502 [Mycena floridula]|nr:hypothetical protein C8J56DRAFT_893502 [Mycena floridula]
MAKGSGQSKDRKEQEKIEKERERSQSRTEKRRRGELEPVDEYPHLDPTRTKETPSRHSSKFVRASVSPANNNRYESLDVEGQEPDQSTRLLPAAQNEQEKTPTQTSNARCPSEEMEEGQVKDEDEKMASFSDEDAVTSLVQPGPGRQSVESPPPRGRGSSRSSSRARSSRRAQSNSTAGNRDESEPRTRSNSPSRNRARSESPTRAQRGTPSESTAGSLTGSRHPASNAGSRETSPIRPATPVAQIAFKSIPRAPVQAKKKSLPPLPVTQGQTPRPADKWPRSSLRWATIFENVHPDDIKGCRDDPDGNWSVILPFPAGTGKGTLFDEAGLLDHIKSKLALLDKSGKDAELVIPHAHRPRKKDSTDRFAAPWIILLGGITDTFKRQLISERVFSWDPRASFRVFDLERDHMSASIMTLTGPWQQSEEKMEDFVRKTMKSHIDPGDRAGKVDEVLKELFIEQREWKGDRGRETKGYHVFLPSPSGDFAWSLTFQKGPVHYVKGKNLFCNNCKADDHLTFDCDWFDVDLMDGPQYDTKFGLRAEREEADDGSHWTGSARGSRGHGARGRRGGDRGNRGSSSRGGGRW